METTLNNQTCPRCEADAQSTLLYQCVRCFSVYCKECQDTSGGRLCPKCGMSQRILLSPNKS